MRALMAAALLLSATSLVIVGMPAADACDDVVTGCAVACELVAENTRDETATSACNRAHGTEDDLYHKIVP